MTHRKKLIEVALPLDAINAAAAREKSIRHGHPSTLHLWWARRPLAAARAVIFAQMVDDPSSRPEIFPTEQEQERERRRLFDLIEELVKWENTTNEELLQQARAEIRASWRRTCADHAGGPRAAALFDPERLPAFHDPFAGGGALPLEAQRLGLEAHASDLNPVAVLINMEAVIAAGFTVNGTWPMRTERPTGVKAAVNALASSIVLVCRRRPADAPRATRRNLVDALEAELPTALIHLQRANIAPVDLAQAAIGPGMAIFTRYAKVLHPAGERVTVREALAFINRTLNEILTAQEGEFDADSLWALAWFDQHGFEAGEFGSAETLATAKNTSVAGMVRAGILHSRAGRVRLLRPLELPDDWDPKADDRLTTWEVVHHLIRVMRQAGEMGAASLLRRLGSAATGARDLCYRLYTLCERKKRADEALDYNGLVQSWPEIARLAVTEAREQQSALFDADEDERDS